MSRRASPTLTLLVTSLALVMVSLDNLVVTVALPVIRQSLNASLSDLEWTVNAYTLTFAALLLLGAALGDRFGRKPMFILGVSIFTIGSAFAALSPSAGALIAARAFQGIGGAICMPLTLTILAESVPPEKRHVALGLWGALGGIATAVGPLIGGAITQGVSWHWIFWVNVPVGILTVILAWRLLDRSFGPDRSLDLVGVSIASLGLVGIVWGVTHGNGRGWTDSEVVAAIAAGFALIAAFLVWESRARQPMMPLHLFRRRGSVTANGISFVMSFGMFGSIFLLAQFFQFVQGLSPLDSGLRILPWTATPVVVAPIAGWASGRIGARPLLAAGLALQAIGLAWTAALTSTHVEYVSLIPAFVIAGAGMGLFFAPIANVVLSSVPREDAGKASGVNNTIRELGGVFGVAVLGAIFSANGSYSSPQTYVNGLIPGVFVGAAVVLGGAALALALPGWIGRVSAAGGTGGRAAGGADADLEMAA